jgi:hypothetical protein
MRAGGRWAMRLAIAAFPLTMCLVPIAPGAWWVILLLGVGVTALLGWLAFGSFCRQMIRGLVGVGRCGACGYPLAELPRDDDGVVTCPECGAAWEDAGTGAGGGAGAGGDTGTGAGGGTRTGAGG